MVGRSEEMIIKGRIKREKEKRIRVMGRKKKEG